MAGAKLEKTRWPGIYRRGSKFAYEWTDAQGKRRRATAETREEASRRKAEKEAVAARGDLGESGARGRLTFAKYALDLYGASLDREPGAAPPRGRYMGRRGAIRDSTRDDYRQQIERYWLPALGSRALGKITPPELSRVLAALAARDRDDYLADSSLRRIFAPAGALLASAVEEGLIAHNVARDVRVPTGRDALRKFDQDADDGDDPDPGRARALTREQLGSFLLVVNERWRLLFLLLASTGLRISEASHCAGATCSSTAPVRWSASAAPSCAACTARRKAATAAATSQSAPSSSKRSVSATRPPSGPARMTSCSRHSPGRRWTTATCARGRLSPQPKRPGCPGLGSTRSGIRARRC